MNQTENALVLARSIGGKNRLNCIAELEKTTAEQKTLAEIVAYYEANPDTMMKYGDTLLRAALDETPGGLQGEPYLKALEARREAIARVTAEIENYDAVLMTGPTSIMHFCGLPTVTVAGGRKAPDGVNETVILYGKDECRLYEAALAIEQVMLKMKGMKEIPGF